MPRLPIDRASRGTTVARRPRRGGGLSPGYFHRRFRAVTGLSPRGYAVAWRARRVREALAADGSVTAAIYDAGFSSSSRFYADSTAIFGMTPRRYRGGGGDEARFTHVAAACRRAEI